MTVAPHPHPARLAIVLLPGAALGRLADCAGDAEKSPGILLGARPRFTHRLDHSDAWLCSFYHPTPTQLARPAMARHELRRAIRSLAVAPGSGGRMVSH